LGKKSLWHWKSGSGEFSSHGNLGRREFLHIEYPIPMARLKEPDLHQVIP